MKKRHVDLYFLITVFVLLGFGLIMVMSASSEWARNSSFTNGDALYFFKRQAIWAVIATFVFAFFALVDYHVWGKFSNIILGGVGLLLVLVLLVGTEVNGGKRWIDLGFMQLQPSEFAKVGLIIWFSWNLAKKEDPLSKFWSGLVPYLGVLLLTDALIVLEKHLSATVLVTLVSVGLLFIAGMRWKHLIPFGIAGVAGAVGLIVAEPYRWKRITAFLDPFADRLGDGYQIIQSLYAIASGGLFGLGLGQSRQKFSYIPEPHNDFIFSIICEELGLIGAILVILLFCILIWRGVRISLLAKDKFGRYLAMGVTMLIAFQVIINIAVVTSSMPVTGMPLPFFSYGGTALTVIMGCMGLVLNVSAQGKK